MFMPKHARISLRPNDRNLFCFAEKARWLWVFCSPYGASKSTTTLDACVCLLSSYVPQHCSIVMEKNMFSNKFSSEAEI